MLRTLCALLFAVHTAAFAAEGIGKVWGIVKSEKGETIKGAQVFIKGLKLGSLTDKRGSYIISNVPAGMQEVTVWMTGYERQTKRVFVVGKETSELDFTLKTRVIQLGRIEVSDTLPGIAVTATMTEMDKKKIPSAVEIITAEEIKDMGALTVADALTESQSLYLQGDEDRALSASIRGLRSTHTLILIDGRRVAAGVSDNVDLDDFSTSMIQRIEIVRGPSSALYGSDAIGGVINIITKQPPENLISGIDFRYGQNKYGEAQNPFIKGYMSEKIGRIGYSLSANIDRKNQYDRYKGTKWTDGDKKGVIDGSGLFFFDLFPNQRLQGGFDAWQVNREGIRPYSWGDGTRVSKTHRNTFYLEYQGKFSEQSSLLFRAYKYRYATDIDIMADILGDIVNPLTQSEEPYNLVQNLSQVEGRWSHLFFSRHMITMGAEARREKRHDNQTDQRINNSAYFFQDAFQVIDPLLLVFGGRYDYHSEFGKELSPKMSATLSITDNFRFKSAYGKGIRAPNIYELFIESSTKESHIRPNPYLKAERSRTYEFGLEGSHKSFSGELRFFRNDLKNMINPLQTGVDTLFRRNQFTWESRPMHWVRPVLQFSNIAQAMTQGWEFAASITLPAGFVLSDETTILKTRDKSTEDRILNKPDLLNNIKLSYEDPLYGIRGNIRIITVGSRKLSNELTADAYTFVNLYGSKRLSRSVEAYAGINNVFNNDPNIYGYMEGSGAMGTFFYCGMTIEISEN